MPTKPAKPAKAKPPIDAASPRGYEHGARASGAQHVRPGRALTPALDLAFALGHGGPAVTPMRLLPDLALAKKPRWKDLPFAFPRNAVLEYVRGEPRTLTPSPLTDAEAARLTRKHVDAISLPWMFLGLEALAGPSCVLAAMVDGIEAGKKRHWDNGGWGALCGPLKGMLLRVPEAEARAARTRLAAAVAKWKHLHGADTYDVLLHGREGIARSGYKYVAARKGYGRAPGSTDAPASQHELELLDPDDGDFVAQQYEALWTAFGWKAQALMMSPASARLLYLGGDAALRTELRVVVGYSGVGQLAAFAACQDLRGPLVTKIMTTLAKPGGKAEKKARAWLDAHA